MAKFNIVYSDNISDVKTKEEAVKQFVEAFMKLSQQPDFADKFPIIKEKDFK